MVGNNKYYCPIEARLEKDNICYSKPCNYSATSYNYAPKMFHSSLLLGTPQVQTLNFGPIKLEPDSVYICSSKKNKTVVIDKTSYFFKNILSTYSASSKFTYHLPSKWLGNVTCPSSIFILSFSENKME